MGLKGREFGAGRGEDYRGEEGSRTWDSGLGSIPSEQEGLVLLHEDQIVGGRRDIHIGEPGIMGLGKE